MHFPTLNTGYRVRIFLSSSSFLIRTPKGSAAQIYGNTGPDYAKYLVKVDNGIVEQFNATRGSPSYQTMLYEINSLLEGHHTLIMTNQPDANGQTFSVNYAVVTRYQDPSSSESKSP